MTAPLSRTELNTLLARLVVGDLPDASRDRLQAAMRADPQVLRYCADVILTAGVLDQVAREGADIAPPRRRTRRRLLRIGLSVAAAVVVVLATSALLRPRHPAPPGRARAAVCLQALDTQWEGHSVSPGTALGPGGYHLRAGSARLRLEGGAEVCLRAPCRFTLVEENALILQQGVLAAAVPPEAVGFTVRTDAVQVVDRGTRFGMIVGPDGRVETHCFVGRVSVYSGPAESAPPNDLRAGSALTLDARGRVLERSPAREIRFPVTLPARGAGRACPGRTLSLADIVGGGNGYGTGRLDQGLDPATGEVRNTPLFRDRTDGRHRFNSLPASTYIDGVFVPNGQYLPVEISSTGLAFDRCPYTNSRYFDGLFNGALLSEDGTQHQAVLLGKVWGTLTRPAINLHPNAGITFDLAALRRDHPGLRITQFRSLCGVSETAPLPRPREIEFWVLVDGRVAEHFLCPPLGNRSRRLRVDLPPRARFLSLATTCPEVIAHGWALFGDPILDLTAQEGTVR